jgi:uncharacterized SAM-binding protein YcdF (DUF218 family)
VQLAPTPPRQEIRSLLIKTIASSLLLPPTSLAFLALVGMLIECPHRCLGRFLKWSAVLGLLILAMPATGLWMLYALESDLPLNPRADQPPKAVVILSGDAPQSGGQSQMRPGVRSFERERAGALLAHRTQLPILVSGGKVHESEPAVSVVMADSLEHELQAHVRWIETESRDTWENAHKSAAILQSQGIHSVYVVTDAWHMRRAILAFRGTGVAVTAAPTYFDRIPLQSATDLVPSFGGWTASYTALHEWIGCAWYGFRILASSIP